MQRRSLDNFLIWTSATFVVVAIAAVSVIQWYSAREIDNTYRERNERIVESAMAQYARTLGEKSFPQAYWDDAVRNLDNAFSSDWAREYIGVFYWRSERIERIATLDRDDRITFAMVEGNVADARSMADFREAIEPLVQRVRAAEIERGPLPLLVELDPAVQAGREAPSKPSSLSVSEAAERRRGRAAPVGSSNQPGALRPIAASGIIGLDSTVFAVAVTLVQPDSSVLPTTDRSAMLVLAKQIDAGVIESLENDYRLPDARLNAGSDPAADGYSSADLRSPTGEVVGRIGWSPMKPGEQLVRKTAPALAIFALLLALSAWLAMRFGSGIARELSESEARATRLAFNDKLTGLPNRTALETAYSDMRARQGAGPDLLGVLCIDIDRFKAVNDSYGHPAGDTLLCEVAARLNRMCERDHALGRFGGDEFMLMCLTPGPTDAARMGETIVTLLGQPFEIESGRVFVGGSVGIVLIDPGAELDASEAFRRADLAMYRAKETGRGQYAFYEPLLDETVRARSEVQSALREALDGDGLDVHYQPQVDENGTLIGVEALVRWPQAESRGVTTASFVQLAEETGLIDRLGSSVMRQVFRDAAKWPGIPTAINLSAVQLRAKDFNDRLEALMREAGVDPRTFEFEITEGVLIDQNEETTARLERLRAAGSRIALDDFGTGYSGLSYLHQYPIDAVKIDMSFTGLLGKEPRAKALVEAIVRLAAALELDVIAEGVETEAQRRLLLEAGCHRFQGYLTGKPMPASELADTFLAPAIT